MSDTGSIVSPPRAATLRPANSRKDRRQTLVEWNDTRRDYSARASTKYSVGGTPLMVRRSFEDQQLTYRQLKNGQTRGQSTQKELEKVRMFADGCGTAEQSSRCSRS